MALVVFVFKDILGFEAYSTEIIRLLELCKNCHQTEDTNLIEANSIVR